MLTIKHANACGLGTLKIHLIDATKSTLTLECSRNEIKNYVPAALKNHSSEFFPNPSVKTLFFNGRLINLDGKHLDLN